ETIWQYAWKTRQYRALQPLVVGSSILLASSLGEGSRRITVTRSEDGTWAMVEDWSSRGMKSDFNDFVYFDGSVYGFDGSIFASIDYQSGSRQWKGGRYGNGQVLLLEESGQLLITSESGEIALVEASLDRLVERARFQAIEGKTWNHSVLIGDRLYVRNAQEAACFRMPRQESR
ncbi:MAG: alcohol dehydrogenase, partial [Planctomycetota bacterium]